MNTRGPQYPTDQLHFGDHFMFSYFAYLKIGDGNFKCALWTLESHLALNVQERSGVGNPAVCRFKFTESLRKV